VLGLGLLLATVDIGWTGTGGSQAFIDSTGTLQPRLPGVPLILAPVSDQHLELNSSGSGQVRVNGVALSATPVTLQTLVDDANGLISNLTAAQPLQFTGNNPTGSHFSIYESAADMFFKCISGDGTPCDHVFEIASGKKFSIGTLATPEAASITYEEPETWDLACRTTDPAAYPANSDHAKLYCKNDGMYARTDSGVVGPFVSATHTHAAADITSGTKSVYIPAGAMEVSGGCTLNAAAALLTNGPRLVTISCTDADADSIEFDWVMPDGWNGGTITVELNAFSIGNNTTEVFEMDVAGQCVRSGDSVAAHATTGEQAATITWGAAANREQHATTAAITLQGTCAGGAHVYMRGQTDSTATTMTPMSDLRILGAKMMYGISSGSD